MNHIIGISGKKQAGKDTIYKIINNVCFDDYKVIRLAFADSLKEEVAFACNVTKDYIEENKDNFRLILQGWGTDFRRRLEGDNYWVDKWKEKVANIIAYSNEPTIIVVPDVRFLNEAECIKLVGGKLWCIAMMNKHPSLIDEHESETQLDYYQDFDWCVKNEYGDINLLKEKVIKQLKHDNIIHTTA